jgi:predicted ribosome quality control (RQC) complex YloA/Tae2 family protein
MSRSERKSVASELRNRLMRRKITAAVVFRDDNVLAIQIEQGRVLAVE